MADASRMVIVRIQAVTYDILGCVMAILAKILALIKVCRAVLTEQWLRVKDMEAALTPQNTLYMCP